VAHFDRLHLDRCRFDAGVEILEHRGGGPTAGAHGEDHGGATGDDVAAGEHAGQVGGLGDRVGRHVAA
jgi:hypothetical protein